MKPEKETMADMVLRALKGNSIEGEAALELEELSDVESISDVEMSEEEEEEESKQQMRDKKERSQDPTGTAS